MTAGKGAVKIHLTGHQREILQRLDLIKVKDGKLLQANSLDSLNLPNKVNSWIFTPSFGRFSGQRQAFLNWSQAMSGAAYVRVLVVRPSEVKEYLQLVQSLGQAPDSLPCTLVMELPEQLSIGRLGSQLSQEYQKAVPAGVVTLDNGIGYARLCIQLVAHVLQLPDVWMLDDSIQDCWQLDLDAEPLQEEHAQHGPLQPCSFFTVMSGIEQHVAASKQPAEAASSQFASMPIDKLWDSKVSPRASKEEVELVDTVQNIFDLSGAHEHVGIIGLNRQPYRHKLVGAKWQGGRGPPPFKVTHSVYCFFLLNVKATCSAQPMVLWPARQYAEDIEMHHMCEDNKLSVIKCNSLFFHKANLQGSAVKQAVELQKQLPSVTVSGAAGPMWGGQQVTVTVSNAQHCRRVTVCGVEAEEKEAQDQHTRRFVVTPPPVTDALAACVSRPDAANIVLSGRITLDIGQPELFVASQAFAYYGLREWGPRTRPARRAAPLAEEGSHSPSYASPTILECSVVICLGVCLTTLVDVDHARTPAAMPV